jgi:hypothetical protein
MSMKRTFYLSVAVVSLASLLGVAPARLSAQSTLALDNDDIGGVVTGPNGPEAGVWVIVETTDFGTLGPWFACYRGAPWPTNLSRTTAFRPTAKADQGLGWRHNRLRSGPTWER